MNYQIVNWNSPRDLNENSLPVVGKIKVGAKDDRGFPVSLPYFRATGRHSEIFHTLLGEKPTSLVITFLRNDPVIHRWELVVSVPTKGARLMGMSLPPGEDDQGVFQEFRIWNGKEWIHTKVRSQHQETQLLSAALDHWRPQASQKTQRDLRWKKKIYIHFMIPKLKQILGEWSFETTAKTSTENILGPIRTALKGSGGRLSLVPFEMSVNYHTKFEASTHNQSFPIVSLNPLLDDHYLETLRTTDVLAASGLKLLTPQVIDETRGVHLDTSVDESQVHDQEITDRTDQEDPVEDLDWEQVESDHPTTQEDLQLVEEIKQLTGTQMVQFWNDRPDYHGKQWFKDAMTERKKQLQNNQK